MGHKFKYPQGKLSMVLILFSTSVQTLTLFFFFFFVMIIVFVRILCLPREILSFQVHFETFPEENCAYVRARGGGGQ